MAWILLILGGLFEVGFTTCLGKVKETSGTESIFWFFGKLRLKHVLTL
jgi:quaternary ammonium compound-resistance protein SugE